MTSVGAFRSAGAGLLAALAIAACGGDDGGGNTDLSPAQAQAIGTAAVIQLGGLASGLTHFTTPGIGGLAGGFLAPGAPGGRMLLSTMGRLNPEVRRSLGLLGNAADCVPTQSDPTDTDGDGIPDDNITTFTAANCSVSDTTDLGEPLTLRVTGSVRIQDTDGASTFFGYSVGISAFTITLADTVSSTPDISISVSGSFGADVQSLLALATQNLRTSLRMGDTRVFADHSNWAVNYTPTSGTITPGAEELPPGELTVNGSYAFSGSNGIDGDWSFALQTPEALVYNGCTDETWPFESGQLRGEISARRTVGFTVDYAGCGVIGTITAFGITAIRQ